MSHELEQQQIGYHDVVMESKAIGGGALRITATVSFRAEITIPAHSRQDPGTKRRCEDNLRSVVRDRFYGDIRRQSVKAARSVDALAGRLSPGYEPNDEDMKEFMPLLNAGDALCPQAPACPACGLTEFVVPSSHESADRGKWFCPCNGPEAPSGYFDV